MDRHDLPEDLREIGERLLESRSQFAPPELDELYGRLRRRAAPRRQAPLRRLRAHSLVAGLSAVLLLTAGGGVVLAACALGGGHTRGFGDPLGHGFQSTFQDTSVHHSRDASFCQYRGPVVNTHTFPTRHGTLIVIVTSYCGRVTVHVEFIPHSGFGFDPRDYGYRWGGGPSYPWGGSSFDTTAPDNGVSSVSISCDGSSYTIPLDN